VLASTAGDLELRIPKLRSGSFFPSLLERRRRVDQSLFAVIMEAYLHGTSTCEVDDLVKALGAHSGISKSEVSRICADLDTEVAAFRNRSLAAQHFPYVFLDTAADGHGRCWALRSATARTARSGTALLRSLKTRGLSGVQLVISDAHVGLKNVIALRADRDIMAKMPGARQQVVRQQASVDNVQSALIISSKKLESGCPQTRGETFQSCDTIFVRTLGGMSWND
jgi:transposase-like protein